MVDPEEPRDSSLDHLKVKTMKVFSGTLAVDLSSPNLSRTVMPYDNTQGGVTLRVTYNIAAIFGQSNSNER